MTKEFCEKNNGHEVMRKLGWMSKPCHALLLLDVKKGGSIKPYFESEEEKDRIIRERCIAFVMDYDDCKRHIEQPTYCFSRLYPGLSNEGAQKIINNEDILVGGSPICPFA